MVLFYNLLHSFDLNTYVTVLDINKLLAFSFVDIVARGKLNQLSSFEHLPILFAMIVLRAGK